MECEKQNQQPPRIQDKAIRHGKEIAKENPEMDYAMHSHIIK